MTEPTWEQIMMDRQLALERALADPDVPDESLFVPNADWPVTEPTADA